LPISVLTEVKVEVDEELWYGAGSDEAAEAQASKSLAARMGRIVGAKPFPAAAQRLSQITQDPNCQMDEVVAVLESDPALSARLLRLVNSVGFALRTPCTSVRHAAALVGTEKLNQVASTAAILDMYESGGERAKQLLEHATVVGALCRYLAFHFSLPPEELFTIGFLHDIGKLMLLDTEGAEYLELLGSETPPFDTTFIEERKRYGFDHALLAGHVLAAWNIPHPVPKVVAWHHHVTRAYAESTAISQMVSTLRLADAMSFALEKPDSDRQIAALARMEAASYMDISEGQLAAMWDEVRALTERARTVFRGEKVEDTHHVHTSRPSGASLRAVARAKHRDRASLNVSAAAPASERPRQFPCVVCGAASYAQRCGACHGYMCPAHIAGEDQWCKLCHDDYEEAGIVAIRPVVSTLFGALAGGLVAAAFFGAAAAGAQRPLRIMIGPTLIMVLFGMLAGVGQRWIRRWWFLRTRPDRTALVPKAVETLLDAAARQNPQIVELESRRAERDDEEPLQSDTSEPASAAEEERIHLMNPEIPAPPPMPQMDAPPASTPPASTPTHGTGARSTPPRSLQPKERTWMSSRTPHPSIVPDRLGSMPPPGVPVLPKDEPAGLEREAAMAIAVAPSSEPLSSPASSSPASSTSTSSEPERASESPVSRERPVESSDLVDELPAAQAAGGGRVSGRAAGSVRPPAESTRPFAGRSERPSGRASRSSGPTRIAERGGSRARSSSMPPSTQRGRAPTPVVTGVRPRPGDLGSEPPRLRTGSAPPRAIEALSPTMLDLPPGLDLTPLESSSARVGSTPPRVESSPPRAEARPKSTEEVPPPAPASATPAPSPPDSPAQPEAVATRGAWSKVLDDQGTASGW
jgi:HD-like signal output (HDOD) protein